MNGEVQTRKDVGKMVDNFYPNRNQMLKEIARCIKSGKLDVLLSFCNCCVHKMFNDSTLVTQCLKCSIHQGITNMSDKTNWTAAPDHEFLGAC